MIDKIKILEKLGQTHSVHQSDSTSHSLFELTTKNAAFTQLKTQNKDLVCMILPDDDDEE